MNQKDRCWYYFGCLNSVGHYLVDRHLKRQWVDELSRLDGQLCPEETPLYRAVLTRIPHLEYSALAWWDKTVDTRPGSNSIIFAPSLTCSLESIRTAMREWFPWVEARLPHPLLILGEERIYTRKTS